MELSIKRLCTLHLKFCQVLKSMRGSRVDLFPVHSGR